MCRCVCLREKHVRDIALSNRQFTLSLFISVSLYLPSISFSVSLPPLHSPSVFLSLSHMSISIGDVASFILLCHECDQTSIPLLTSFCPPSIFSSGTLIGPLAGLSNQPPLENGLKKNVYIILNVFPWSHQS